MKWREERKGLAHQDQKITRESSGKNWARIPRDCQELGVLRTCSKAKMRLRQLKRSAKKHKERRTNSTLLATQWCRKNQKTWGLTIHEQWASTSGAQKEEPWKEVAGKIFNLAGMESAYSGKMTKGKATKKLSLKMWGLEALKEKRIEVSSLGTPQNGKSARGF